jgi:hypothetical protein
MHGMGNSPSWLVEGSWVIGFFRDAVERQQPIIIGSLPGQPVAPADFRTGFNDPRHNESTQVDEDGIKIYAEHPEKENEYGPYPLGALKVTNDETKGKFGRFSGHTYGETDTNRLAQGMTSETHAALARRREDRRSSIPTATRSGKGTLDEPRDTWDEPHPKGIAFVSNPLNDPKKYMSATYPLNHVYESESGHITEIDDTPLGERLHREHMSGTFEEIHPTGDKVVKVVGSNYEIIAGSSNVFINGDVNLTIVGNKKELIKKREDGTGGHYILEVEGDYTRRVHENDQLTVSGITGIKSEGKIIIESVTEIDADAPIINLN